MSIGYFHKFFCEYGTNMGSNHNTHFFGNANTFGNPSEKIVEKYKSHSSITPVNKHMAIPELTFFFQPVT